MISLQKWYGFGDDEAYDRGVRLFENGLFADAIEAFCEVLDRRHDPSTIKLARHYKASSHIELGKSAFKHDDLETAREHFLIAGDHFPNYADVQFWLAACADLLGLSDERDARVRRSLELNAHFCRALLLWAAAQWEAGESGKGLNALDLARQVDAHLAPDRLKQARDFAASGDLVRAAGNVRAVAIADDNEANFHAEVADRLARQKQWFEAAEEYSNALALEPGYADIHCKLGQALLHSEQFEEAIKHLRAAIAINPHYADAHAMLGIVYRRLGQENKAKQAFRAALDAEPDHLVATTEFSRRM